ncbi:MmpS family transport accessory protein [Mycobacterium sp. E1747]|uniref:MmpS family transport accessory protein n=1 Tax=Mycobacterium sp. E1747 TaxID=1834128 RepID=UPI0007FB8047|nr:MmpS family transport accessory protein [Mycobacterium sp. E1747]OBH14044.1 hypothetical protein A5695_12645 [Mycobacterium sp. E1747]
MTRLVRRSWLILLVVVAVGLGTVVIAQFRSIFGSNAVLVTPNSSDTADSFSPKIVTYQVSGSATTADINYLDLDAKPQRVPRATLPWSLTLRTTAPSATPNILAQGDGQTITCRITVDDVVKDERTATGDNAETFCLVKSA